MVFRQITHDDLGCASYLIGDEDAGVAAVVDPRLEIGEYLRLARYLGVWTYLSGSERLVCPGRADRTADPAGNILTMKPGTGRGG